MYSSPLPCYRAPLRPKCHPQRHILEHIQPTFLLQCGWPSFTPIQNNRQNYSSVYFSLYNLGSKLEGGRSQWPLGLRRGSVAARLLELWVRIPPGAWMSVSCDSCVLSGRGLCDELITRTEESYQVWCVCVCVCECECVCVCVCVCVCECVWVWSWIFDNEEALAYLGLLRRGEKNGRQNILHRMIPSIHRFQYALNFFMNVISIG